MNNLLLSTFAKVYFLVAFLFNPALANAIDLLRYNENNVRIFQQSAFVNDIGVGAPPPILASSFTPVTLYGYPTGFFPANDQDPYFQWGVTVTNETVKVTRLDLQLEPNTNGPTSIRIEVFVDSLASPIHGTSTVLQRGVSNSVPVIINNAPAADSFIVIRVHGARALSSTNTGTLSFDNNSSGFALRMQGDIVLTPLEVTTINPGVYSNGFANVSTTALNPITLNFSKGVTVSGQPFSLDCFNSGLSLGYTFTQPTSTQVQIQPFSTVLATDDVCQLSIDRNSVTASGQILSEGALGGNTFYAYLTPDTGAPYVDTTLTTPTNGATIGTTSSFEIVFSEVVLTPLSSISPPIASTVTSDFTTFTCDGSAIAMTHSFADVGGDLTFGKKMTLSPVVDLPYASSCTLNIFGFRDFFGASNFVTTSINFVTDEASGHVNALGSMIHAITF